MDNNYEKQPQVIINNTQTVQYGKKRNKYVSFFLCLFLGGIGIHKFYEGKTGRGILYLFTCGLFFIGWGIDTIILFINLFNKETDYIV